MDAQGDAPGEGTVARPRLAVVRATGDDWAEVRTVRLAALADSPSAFGSTAARERDFDEARWRAWTSAAVFLLVDGAASGNDGPRGLAAGVPARQGARQVVAVWVHPSWRGLGGADLLLEAVEDWARREGAERLELWLTRGNARARRLYERRGFVETGRSKPLPSDPGLVEDEMAVALT